VCSSDLVTMTNENSNRNWLIFLLAFPLLLITESLWRALTSNYGRSIQRSLREPRQWNTPKFSASKEGRVLNVHIVPHTHDDVGWLKTVEQYYYGLNQSIQHAHVQSILTTVVQALVANPNRTFTYVETKYFSMWWTEQCDNVKETVKELILNGQFVFVNGGWCMHDEGATHFMGMIDQTTLGHDFLRKELGVIPTVGWQLDPFGHSATQASYMTHEMGFDALYFGRIDYQDLKKRHDEQECEGLWASTANQSSVFWGLTGSYGGNYGPPGGFCFDINCDDEPIVDMDEERLLEKVTVWATSLQAEASRTKGNHIMQTMGSDFAYEQAAFNFANYDLLMNKLLEYQETKQIDIPSIFGPDYDRLNIFYSTPAYYTEMKNKEAVTNNGVIDWKIKNDDFMPYADVDHGFWTGYFTSRTGFKRLERVGSSFLLAARQIESMHRVGVNVGMGDCKCMQPLYDLEDALGVSQHHDAISGTAKQHVADDYAKRLHAGIDKAASYVSKKIKKMLFNESDLEIYFNDIMFCQLLNETKCEVSERASKDDDYVIFIVVYNPLATIHQTVIGIPIEMPRVGKELMANRVGDRSVLRSRTIPPKKKGGKFIYYFDTGPMPPTGAVLYKLVWSNEIDGIDTSTFQQRVAEADGGITTVSNGVLTVAFDSMSGGIKNVKTVDGISLDLSQEWGYYTSFDSGGQDSGAYIFRPSEPDAKISEIKPRSVVFEQNELVTEIIVEFENPWIQQTMRLYENKSFIEVEYTIGPIPIDDGVGKEIVTKYSSGIKNNGVFYTDSNGREFMKRIRNFRPTWQLNNTEPVAGNYYPVNSAIFIEDNIASLGIATDRSIGGSSLEDGTVEVMVQRRILRDDFRGVGEALNETTRGVNPYPPYGDATRQGEGIIIKGMHRLVIGGGGYGAKFARLQMDEMFASPLVFAASAPSATPISVLDNSFALIQEALPTNVMLITYKLLPDAPATTFLVRLGHQFGEGEDPHGYSSPTRVCLSKLVLPYSIVSIVEMTLSGNQVHAAWSRTRMNWTGEIVPRRTPVACLGDSCMIELNPMEIRTFHINVVKEGGLDVPNGEVMEI